MSTLKISMSLEKNGCDFRDMKHKPEHYSLRTICIVCISCKCIFNWAHFIETWGVNPSSGLFLRTWQSSNHRRTGVFIWRLLHIYSAEAGLAHVSVCTLLKTWYSRTLMDISIFEIRSFNKFWLWISANTTYPMLFLIETYLMEQIW